MDQTGALATMPRAAAYMGCNGEKKTINWKSVTSLDIKYHIKYIKAPKYDNMIIIDNSQDQIIC